MQENVSAKSDLMDLEIPVEVWLASEEMQLDRLLPLKAGDLLPLSRDPDGPVDLVVNGVVIASGQLVVADGRLGLRVTEVAMQKPETLKAEIGAQE